jgi:hypothetical protein
MKKLIVLLLSSFSLLVTFDTNAQKLSPGEQKRVNDIFKKGTVAYFKFPVTSTQEITPLSKMITIDKVQGRMVFAHANKDAFSKFIGKGYAFTIIKMTSPATKPKKKK